VEGSIPPRPVLADLSAYEPGQSQTSFEAEERLDRWHRRPTALRLPAGVPRGLDPDSRAAADPPLLLPGGEAGGEDEESPIAPVDGEGSGLQQAAARPAGYFADLTSASEEGGDSSYQSRLQIVDSPSEAIQSRWVRIAGASQKGETLSILLPRVRNADRSLECVRIWLGRIHV
jgi:hypothetical protein